MSDSLYQRLGREEGIAAIVKDVLDNHLKNPLLKTRFQDSDLDKVHRRAVEFFAEGCGGPLKYTGKDMRETHRSMNINEQEFIATVDDILSALDKNSIDPETRTEVLGILYSLKDDIIRQ